MGEPKLIEPNIRVSDVTQWGIYSVSNCALSEVYLMDCIAGMKHYPDKFFDLAVVDPPYGIGADKAQNAAAEQREKANGKSKAGRGWKKYKKTDWDNEIPTRSAYAKEQGVSYNAAKKYRKNIIIFGVKFIIDNV